MYTKLYVTICFDERIAYSFPLYVENLLSVILISLYLHLSCYLYLELGSVSALQHALLLLGNNVQSYGFPDPRRIANKRITGK